MLHILIYLRTHTWLFPYVSTICLFQWIPHNINDYLLFLIESLDSIWRFEASDLNVLFSSYFPFALIQFHGIAIADRVPAFFLFNFLSACCTHMQTGHTQYTKRCFYVYLV